MQDSVFAVLMAAGFSQRFGGGNKLLFPFRGKPLARHTLDLACGMDCFGGIVFVSANSQTDALAAGLPVTVIRNAAPEKGQGESVRLGVLAIDALLEASHCPAEKAHYLFLPCDQPLLDAETLCRIVNARSPGRIVEPRYQQTPCSPSLFSGTFRSELLALAPGEQPRVIKARHPDAVVHVEIENPLIVTDIDQKEDLQKLEML